MRSDSSPRRAATDSTRSVAARRWSCERDGAAGRSPRARDGRVQATKITRRRTCARPGPPWLALSTLRKPTRHLLTSRIVRSVSPFVKGLLGFRARVSCPWRNSASPVWGPWGLGALGSDRFGALGRVDLGGCPPRSTRPNGASDPNGASSCVPVSFLRSLPDRLTGGRDPPRSGVGEPPPGRGGSC